MEPRAAKFAQHLSRPGSATVMELGYPSAAGSKVQPGGTGNIGERSGWRLPPTNLRCRRGELESSFIHLGRRFSTARGKPPRIIPPTLSTTTGPIESTNTTVTATATGASTCHHHHHKHHHHHHYHPLPRPPPPTAEALRPLPFLPVPVVHAPSPPSRPRNSTSAARKPRQQQQRHHSDPTAKARTIDCSRRLTLLLQTNGRAPFQSPPTHQHQRPPPTPTPTTGLIAPDRPHCLANCYYRLLATPKPSLSNVSLAARNHKAESEGILRRPSKPHTCLLPPFLAVHRCPGRRVPMRQTESLIISASIPERPTSVAIHTRACTGPGAYRSSKPLGSAPDPPPSPAVLSSPGWRAKRLDTLPDSDPVPPIPFAKLRLVPKT